jgi:hypothetical protein
VGQELNAEAQRLAFSLAMTYQLTWAFFSGGSRGLLLTFFFV